MGASLSREETQIAAGYLAAARGVSADRNPCLNRYYFDLWEHGWVCYRLGIVPYAAEKGGGPEA